MSLLIRNCVTRAILGTKIMDLQPPESPSETEEKAIEKQQNDIDTLEKHAKYIAEHYYRYRF